MIEAHISLETIKETMAVIPQFGNWQLKGRKEAFIQSLILAMLQGNQVVGLYSRIPANKWEGMIEDHYFASFKCLLTQAIIINVLSIE